MTAESPRAEQAQQAAYRRTVESINSWPLSCLGSTAEEIRTAIKLYEQFEIPEIPPHYAAEATSAKKRALGKLWEMLVTRINLEGPQMLLAAERAELDRQRVEHARIERELAEERARIADAGGRVR